MKRAQSTLEYAVVIGCIVAALVAMQVYIKRGMQGRLRQAADELGQQYAPKNTTSDMTLTYDSDIETKVETKEKTGEIDPQTGKEKEWHETTTNVIFNKEEQTRKGNETVGGLDETLF